MAISVSGQTNSPQLSSTLRLFVREFRFEGNTVFSNAELSRITAPYTNREISSTQLEEARRAITLQYVNRGFINSGAVIPDQKPADGIIHIKIVEGILSEINVYSNQWLRGSYLRSRIDRWSGPPLNLKDLQEGLQLIRQNPNVKQVNAELRPGSSLGESILDMAVRDCPPFRLGLQIDNQRPPSVGAEEFTLLAGDRNLTGHNDELGISYVIAHATQNDLEFSGIDNVSTFYRIPVTPYDTTLEVHADRSDFAIIEEPFTSLDISSESYSFGGALRQPLYQSANREFALSFGFDRRFSQTFQNNKPFFISPGADAKGVSCVSVIRFAQEWVDRSEDHVLALRSTVNWGINALDATDNGTSRDATFVSWQGQAQYVQRLFHTANQIILRANGQWTDDGLLSLEQFSVGGFNSVRGYRENQLVRDRGVFTSAEFRVPVLYDRKGAAVLQLAPFVDFGGGWNVGEKTPDPATLASSGLGLLLNVTQRFSAQLYWGYAFNDVHGTKGDSQDLGLHFRINFEAF
jgi:hemolysin activation/secretion protein